MAGRRIGAAVAARKPGSGIGIGNAVIALGR